MKPRFALFAIALALTAQTFALGAPQARAQGDADEAEAEPEPAPSSATPYWQAVRRGLDKTIARDLDGAAVEFREAIQLEPGQVEAHYYLGVALRLKGEQGEALGSLDTARQMAVAQSSVQWQVRVMNTRADLLEEMPGRLGEAREAWGELLSFAQSNPTAMNSEWPRARLTAIDRAIEQERVYIEVRQAIAAREAELAQQESERQAREAERSRRGRRGRRGRRSR